MRKASQREIGYANTVRAIAAYIDFVNHGMSFTVVRNRYYGSSYSHLGMYLNRIQKQIEDFAEEGKSHYKSLD